MNKESFLRGEVSQSTKSCEFKPIDLKNLAKKKLTHPKLNKQLEAFTGKVWRLLKNRMWWSSQWRIEALGLH